MSIKQQRIDTLLNKKGMYLLPAKTKSGFFIYEMPFDSSKRESEAIRYAPDLDHCKRIADEKN